MNEQAARFFFLVFMLSVPFYLLGAAGGRMPGLAILPASALMTFVPMIAALMLGYRRRGDASGKRGCPLAWNRRAVWFLVALLFMPLVCILEFSVLHSTGTGVPLPQIEPDTALVFFLVFFIGAIGEEVGWQGYAYPALRVRKSALASALILGTVWAVWHVVPFVQLGRGSEWIFWHSLSAVALRIVIVWLFENTRQSILVAVLFHTMINVSWALFPNEGSFYDPRLTFAILILTIGLGIGVWGRTMLTEPGVEIKV